MGSRAHSTLQWQIQRLCCNDGNLRLVEVVNGGAVAATERVRVDQSYAQFLCRDAFLGDNPWSKIQPQLVVG